MIYEEPLLVFLFHWSYFKLHVLKNVNGKSIIDLSEGKVSFQSKWNENNWNLNKGVSIQNCPWYSFILPESQCGGKRSPTRTAVGLRLCSRTNVIKSISSGFTEKPCLKTFMVENELKFYGCTEFSNQVHAITLPRQSWCVPWDWKIEKFEVYMLFRTGAVVLCSSCCWRGKSLPSWEFLFLFFFCKVTAI